MSKLRFLFLSLGVFFSSTVVAYASEADLAIPDLREGTFHVFGMEMTSWNFLFYGALIIAGTLGFSLLLF
jgi:K(+)-stimulated pyrophosphate-energized sodium pump